VAMPPHPTPTQAERPPAASPELLDRADPEAEIARAAAAYSNWGRWGADDVLGTVNFITDDLRRAAAGLVRRGASFSLSQRFDMDGPQKGWRRRTNPVHTMLDTGTDAAAGLQGFPHGIGGADDVIAMPLQCSTQWDGLGHIFDHGMGGNGRPREMVITGAGDEVTGVERQAAAFVSRGVLLDLGRVLGQGELDDGFTITEEHLRTTIYTQDVTVGRGDIVLIRTGQLTRCRRLGSWAGYSHGPAPGLSFGTLGWLHGSEIAAIASDTCALEVRPYEFGEPCFAPLHQIAIPNMGLAIGEMFDLDALAAECAARRVYEFLLVAAGLPITGGVGAPVNPVAIM
jgi:kynurenine formamidase